MLILSRKLQQSIILRVPPGFVGDIKMVLESVKGLSSARIGIVAPPEIEIYRSELLDPETGNVKCPRKS